MQNTNWTFQYCNFHIIIHFQVRFPHYSTSSDEISHVFDSIASYFTFSHVIGFFFFSDASDHFHRSKLFILTCKSSPLILDWLFPHVDSNLTCGSQSPVCSESTLLIHLLHSHSSFSLKNSKRLFKSKSTQRVPQKYIYLCRAAPAKIQLTWTACSVRAEKKDWERSDLPLSKKRQETISPRVSCLTFSLFVFFFFSFFFFFILDHYHVYSKTKPFFFRWQIPTGERAKEREVKWAIKRETGKVCGHKKRQIERERRRGERESQSAWQSAEQTSKSPLLSVTTPPCDQRTKWNKALEVLHVVFRFILFHHHSSSP